VHVDFPIPSDANVGSFSISMLNPADSSYLAYAQFVVSDPRPPTADLEVTPSTPWVLPTGKVSIQLQVCEVAMQVGFVQLYRSNLVKWRC
jgi:hypothetical protein